MIKNKHYLTKEKYEELQKELQNLEIVKRKEVAEKLEYARSLGDLAENAEYHDARSEQAEIESRINYLTELLKNVEFLKPHHTNKVEIGSVVTIRKKDEKEKIKYQIVSSEEADISENKISYESPLGCAMIGKSKKEEFSFETPKGATDYVIVNID